MRRLGPVLLALVLAGCLGSSSPASSPSPSTSNAGLPAGAPSPDEANRPRTLEEAPQWRLGEWWKVRLTDFTGRSYEVLRVVGGTLGDDYLVGMPKDAFSNDLMVIHLPGFGQVRRDDLSFEIHDVRYEPLRFPLKDGARWRTAFEGRAVNATVHVENATRARIQLDGKTDHINATYDATIGEIVRHADPKYATYEVVAHGYDHRGTIEVPYEHDLIFQDVRIATLVSSPIAPKPMPSEVSVAKEYDRVSFVLLVGDVVTSDPVAGPAHNRSLGSYKLVATAPNKREYEVSLGPGGPAFGMRFFEDHAPTGDWRFEHTVVGPGFSVAEGIAYKVYDVELPSGVLRTSSGEHTHTGPCAALTAEACQAGAAFP